MILLKTLTKHITAQLEDRAFCVIFEQDVERCWPCEEMTLAKRESEIQSFAESQGWTVEIVQGGFGTRAIFERPGRDIVGLNQST